MTRFNPVIGLFDSGVGGLSVLQKLLALHPNLNYAYLADSAYFPYSTQSAAFIEKRVLQLCQWMEKKYPLQALVMACNTASATTYADLVEYDLPFPVYEPIGVTCQYIQNNYASAKNIVVLATPVTVATNAYLTNLSAQFDVTQLPSTELVKAVEQGVLMNERKTLEARAILNPLMQAILSHKPDVLVLGSTHFSWASVAISKYLPETVHLVDSAHCLASTVCRLNLEHSDNTVSDIMTTQKSIDFDNFIKQNLKNVTKSSFQIDVEETVSASLTA